MLRLASKIPRRTVRWASTSNEDFDDTKSFRSDVKQVHLFDPMLNYDDFFGVLDKIKWQDLAINRMQYGHHESVRDPYMTQYLLGNRCGIDIIDIDKSRALLASACNFAGHVAMRGGVILFATTLKSTNYIAQAAAVQCGEYTLLAQGEKPLKDNVVPDLIIILPVAEPSPGILSELLVEAAEKNIPTIGVVDTNINPSLISYPIPGNDDHMDGLQYVARQLIDVINQGKETRQTVGRSVDAHRASGDSESDFMLKLTQELKQRVDKRRELAKQMEEIMAKQPENRAELRLRKAEKRRAKKSQKPTEPSDEDNKSDPQSDPTKKANIDDLLDL